MVLDETLPTSEQEFTADMLNIVHVLSSRMHGLRSYKKQIHQIITDSRAESDV